MDKLCNRLTETYNTNVLDDTNKITQAAFYSEAQKHKGGDKGRTVLMDLIYNHYRKYKPTPMFIGGPRTLTLHWSAKYQMLVYNFGEWHSSNMDCHGFDDFWKRKGGLATGKKKTRAELRDECPKGQVRNPTTKRCVKETGPTGLRLLEENDALPDKTPKQLVAGEMPVEDFLEQLVENTDAFLDIYFEFPAYTGDEYDNIDVLAHGARLERLLNRFKTCLQYAQRAAKKCRLARVHYFDIRKEEKEGVHDTAWFRRKIQRASRHWGKQKVTELKDLLRDDPRIRKVLDGLNSSTDIEYIAFWQRQVDENPYVQKEFKRTPLRDPIEEFIKKEIKTEAQTYRGLFRKNIPMILNPANDDIFVTSFQTVYEATVIANARVADAYTLARVFKTFDTTKPTAKGETVDQPTQPHNIIIYAGNAHNDLYRKFLETIGFKELAKTGSSTDAAPKVRNCIDMKNFPQPLFSNIPENKGFLATLFGW